MDAERRQQLYGGEISDYYKRPLESKNDNKEIGDIYDKIKNKKPSLNSLRFDPSNNSDNKL